jgi:hypothetical protein
MNNFKFVKIDRVIGELKSEFDDDIINEDQVVSLIGESLQHLTNEYGKENIFIFLKVSDFKTRLPDDVYKISKVYRKINSNNEKLSDLNTSQGNKEDYTNIDFQNTFYKYPNFYSNYSNINYKFLSNFEEIYRSSRPIFNQMYLETEKVSIEEKNHVYEVIENTYIVTSFKSSIIGVYYKKEKIDEDTGYPMVPDDFEYIIAIKNYVKWKLSEAMFWKNRQGSAQKIQYFQNQWYLYKSKVNAKQIGIEETFLKFLNKVKV